MCNQECKACQCGIKHEHEEFVLKWEGEIIGECKSFRAAKCRQGRLNHALGGGVQIFPADKHAG